MINSIIKLFFPNGIHLGEGDLSDFSFNLQADTLFSALCIEALNLEGEEGISKLVKLAIEGKILISDALPFIKDTLYLPKPIITIPRDGDEEKDEALNKKNPRKIFKKLKYIPKEKFSDFVKGKISPLEAEEITENFKLGKGEIHTKVKIKETTDATPFHLGIFKFCENAGLYFILNAEDNEHKDFFMKILKSLSFSGLGGKRSSGFGKFTFEETLAEINTNETYDSYVSLSISLPKKCELDSALKEASYSIIKRSGFVSSETYAESLVRKKDLFAFKAGSVFKNK
ncbi:MAG: type III-A CRISPR-associated RAMP protein Csm4, partial [Defluviitaleaceae bacterium]|nr:type III-A CRISPR-associated RAMP protein Csm4 [Defluviitaleaceae bacterium]